MFTSDLPSCMHFLVHSIFTFYSARQLQLPDRTIINTGDTVLIDNVDGDDFVAIIEDFHEDGE